VTASDGRHYPGDLPRHSVSAGAAVIRADGRMLAIKRADNGKWVLPGGIVELDEDPRDTVRREVLEETGVAVEPDQLTGVYKNMRLGVVSLVFRCRPVSGVAQPTAEATEVAWLDITQVVGCMAEAFAIRLIDALGTDEPRIRIHDGQHLLTKACVSRPTDSVMR
jgi:8-oxo-dGTP diphosphatase